MRHRAITICGLPACLGFWALALSAGCSTDSSDLTSGQDASSDSDDALINQGGVDGNSSGDGSPVVIPPNLSTATGTFPSSDGVQITVDLYIQHPSDAPFIILAHRADWSRGEYLEIAPRLNALGMNAMAIDLRSGKQKFEVVNATNEAALAAGKPTLYLDALVDFQASLDYVKTNYAKGPILIWGSSFSASLAIMLVKANPERIAGLICFAPGEYFGGQYGRTKTSVQEAATGLTLPTFFTSKKSEFDATRKAIFAALASEKKTYFVPETEGKHGSEALFSTTPEQAAYWEALISFLKPFIP